MGGIREQHEQCLGMACGRLWRDRREGCGPSRETIPPVWAVMVRITCTIARATTQGHTPGVWPPTVPGPRKVKTGRVGYEGWRL